MNRSERRRLQRETKPTEWGAKLLENTFQAFYETMRDNRIGEERAEKILHEAMDKMGDL